ncbi:MAG: alkaline phosphatase [Victivallales bacterium]
MKRLICLIVASLVSFSAFSQKMMPKNIVFMIGDGMGFEQVKAAGMYLNGQGGTLSFESLPVKGEVTTKSADSAVTDSAAAATAMATGSKVNNQVVSIALPGDGKDLKTFAEFFKEYGKRTGILTNSYLNDATPACFSGHARKRSDFDELSRIMMKNVHPDLLFGGGCKGMSADLLRDAGYAVATDLKTMEGLTPDSKYWAGLFGTTVLPFEKDGDYGRLPRLSQMVKKALLLLDNEKGFFIMIEGGLIDRAGHGNNLEKNIGETVEFGNAVKTVLDWAKDRSDTLIIVTADHETGGLTVVKNRGKGNYPEVTWRDKGHSGVNVPLYAWGENSDAFGKTMDNTDFFKTITSWK